MMPQQALLTRYASIECCKVLQAVLKVPRADAPCKV